LGEKLDDYPAPYLLDISTVSANLAGIPAISFSLSRLPNQFSVAIQIMSKSYNKTILFQGALG